MDETVYWFDRSTQLQNNAPVGIVQHFRYQDTLLTLHCDLVEYSFCPVKEGRVCHPNPLFSRLTLVETGHVHLTVNGTDRVIPAGSIYYLPSGLPFLAEYERCAVTGFHLHVYDGLKFNDSEYLKHLVVLANDPLSAAILAAVRTKDSVQTDSAVFAAVAKCMSTGFPAMYERTHVPLLYREIIGEMDRHPLAALRLDKLARRFRITPDAVSKGFHRTFGISWLEYRNQRLLLEARRRLYRDDCGIAQIARELGFDNVNYFFVFFKRHTGMTPLRFRNQLSGRHL